MNVAQAKQIAMRDLPTRLGHEPAKARGRLPQQLITLLAPTEQERRGQMSG